MGQPAARVTDMQTCPMVDGIVPHVGGPISLGCFTVLVSSMPQARISDMHACVGPPGTMAVGSPTVLVGGMPASSRRRFNRAWWRGGRTRRAHRPDRVSEDATHIDRPALPAGRRAGGAPGRWRRVLDRPRRRQRLGAAGPDETPVEAALRHRLPQGHLAGGRHQHKRHVRQPRREVAGIRRAAHAGGW